MYLYNEVEKPNCEVRNPRLSAGEEVNDKETFMIEII